MAGRQPWIWRLRKQNLRALTWFRVAGEGGESAGRKEGCRHYGYILEQHMDVSLRVCGNRAGGREAHLYNTESNVVDIVIARDDSQVSSYSYLIQYQGLFSCESLSCLTLGLRPDSEGGVGALKPQIKIRSMN